MEQPDNKRKRPDVEESDENESAQLFQVHFQPIFQAPSTPPSLPKVEEVAFPWRNPVDMVSGKDPERAALSYLNFLWNSYCSVGEIDGCKRIMNILSHRYENPTPDLICITMYMIDKIVVSINSFVLLKERDEMLKLANSLSEIILKFLGVNEKSVEEEKK